jgi:WD40 repeat protein
MLLATCSFDGTVKLWDLDNSTNNAPADQFRSSSTAVSMLTMTQYDTTSRRCQLNQIDVPQNVGRVSLLQDDCGLEVSMIDSFPLMSYGRKQADGVMNTAHGLWYSVSWSSDGSYRYVQYYLPE